MARLSILLPANNYGLYLRDVIDSALAQSATDFEVVIVDDASTDTTWETITSYRDDRIVALRNDNNQGLSASLNRALGASSGAAVVILNADDRMHPDFLRRAWQALLDTGPQVGVAGVRLRAVDEQGRHIVGHPAEKECSAPLDFNAADSWIWRNWFPGCALIRREVFEVVGGFAEDISTAVTWDLWVRVLAADIGLIVVPEVLCDRRVHEEEVTDEDSAKTLVEYALISQRHLHPYLIRIGRRDLLAQNVAGFLRHPGLIYGDPPFAQTVVSRLFSLLDAADQVAAVQLLGHELLRLRAEYSDQLQRADFLESRVNGITVERDSATQVLAQREYELTAALDRLVAAEVDRRAARAELARWENAALFRLGRRATRALRK